MLMRRAIISRAPVPEVVRRAAGTWSSFSSSCRARGLNGPPPDKADEEMDSASLRRAPFVREGLLNGIRYRSAMLLLGIAGLWLGRFRWETIVRGTTGGGPRNHVRWPIQQAKMHPRQILAYDAEAEELHS